MQYLRFFIILLLLCPAVVTAQFIFGDLLPDAPSLANRGEFGVGVRTLRISNPEQPNLLDIEDGIAPTYTRDLTLEIWYPAIETNANNTVAYEEVMGTAGDSTRPLLPFVIQGRAARNAQPNLKSGPFPLVIVSHGYVGSRYLMTYLTENLASKGYVVVAIDHKESTFRDAGPFHSTLYYRSVDQLFTLNEIDRLSLASSNSFLSGLVNTQATAIVGYSMGGYGALNVAGAGYSQQLGQFFAGQTGGNSVINSRMMGNSAYPSAPDQRIKAIVAFAPWGKNWNVWDEDGLKGLQIPTLFIAGDQDDISGYENGIRAIFEGATEVERYLLTYQGARHNVAPNPPPPEALAPGLHLDEYLRYADSVWDTRRMNNINQHFITAFLAIKLKADDNMQEYLDLPLDSNANNWKGFKPRTAVGLQFEAAAVEKK